MKEETSVTAHPKKNSHIVEVRVEHDGWPGKYSFLTDGMTTEQVVAKRVELVAHHMAKAERLSGFNRMNRLIGDCFISALSVVERGTNVEVVLRAMTPDGETLDLDFVVPTISDVPSDEELVQRAVAAVEQHGTKQAAKDVGAQILLSALTAVSDV